MTEIDRTTASLATAPLLAEDVLVLLDDQEPSPRSGALAALLSASGALPALHRDLPWSGALYTRGQQLQRGEWGAAATGEAVAASAAAVAAAVLSNSLFVSVVLPSLRD